MFKFKIQKSKIKTTNKNLKILNFILAICILGVVFVPSYAEDKIIAIVNKEVITQKDLNDFLNFIRLQLSKEYKGRELEKRLQAVKLDLLDKLIEDRLILQEAKDKNIRIDENRVKARLREIKSHYFSDTEFQRDLAKQGLVQADIESKIREQFLMYNIVKQEVQDKITVNPEEVTSFYNKNIKDFIIPQERQLQVIILENKDLATTFFYGLKSGQKLVDLATRYPITVNELKASKRGELRKEIEDVVFKLSIGEISEPIGIDDKYYIFNLVNVTTPRRQSLREVQDRIHNFLFEKKMQEKLTEWLDGLKAKSYIKVMQRAYEKEESLKKINSGDKIRYARIAIPQLYGRVSLKFNISKRA